MGFKTKFENFLNKVISKLVFHQKVAFRENAVENELLFIVISNLQSLL